jgi:integrase
VSPEIKPSLAAFAAEVWAPRAERRLAPKTWERDSLVLRKHVLPRLGDAVIADLDVEDLVGWQEELERDGVGDPTIIKAITILSSIFREALRRPRSTGVFLNPVSLLEKPSAGRVRRPSVWGPLVVERVRFQLLAGSRRVGRAKRLMAVRDAALISLMEMTGCRPGEALALRWSEIGRRVWFVRALSGKEIVERTKTGRDRWAPLPAPLRSDLEALRSMGGDGADDYVFQTPAQSHWIETDWRNYRSRHFVPALERVEAEWEDWRRALRDPEAARESVRGLAGTRPYDLGRHTHSALMLASGMSLQRLARIQGHSIRVLDQAYAEELYEFKERSARIDPVAEIERARAVAWEGRDPSTGEWRESQGGDLRNRDLRPAQRCADRRASRPRPGARRS